jgi:hypothetical protein
MLGEYDRRRALAERYDRVPRRKREVVAVALDEPGSQENSSSITLIARGGERMKSSWPINCNAA